MSLEESESADNKCGWEELPEATREYLSDKFDEDFRDKFQFINRSDGRIDFSYSAVSTHPTLTTTVSDNIEGWVMPDKKVISVSHHSEQLTGVVEKSDPDAGGGASIMSYPEYHSWGMVYKEEGQDSSLFVVAKDWQMNIPIDANGYIDLSEKRKKEMEEHFGSTLGISNMQKIDLRKTLKSITRPLSESEFLLKHNRRYTFEEGLPLPDIPVVSEN